MNKQSLKKHVAFIITLMMFSIMPALVNAQKKCPDGNCPKGQVCVNGVCVKSGGGTFCNCFVRPIPIQCGQICGWITTANESLSISSANSNAISFELIEAQNVSAKIHDATGRLVKTFADKIFEKGEHKLQWDAAGVKAGIYIVQINAGTYSETKKIAVIK